MLPDRLNWLCYFAGSSKSHCENLISFIFLESPHQVDIKNITFFGVFQYSRNSQWDVSNSNWQKYFGWVKNVHAANSSYASAIVRNMLSFSNWLLEFLFETTYILLKCALYYANVSNWLKGHKNFTVIALIFMHLSWFFQLVK